MLFDYVPRTVADVVAIHPYHQAQMDLFRSFRHHPSEYTSSQCGVIEYTSQCVRPYGELILKAIPAGVHAPSMLPIGRFEELLPHIIEFLVQTSLIYTIALERGSLISQLPAIHPSCSYCFLLAQRFDMIAGFPVFNGNPGTCDAILSRPPIVPFYFDRGGGPPWDRQRIAELLRAEMRDPWVCETALLEDEMSLSDNLGDAFVKALKADLDGPYDSHKLWKIAGTGLCVMSKWGCKGVAPGNGGSRALAHVNCRASTWWFYGLTVSLLLGEVKPVPSRMVEVLHRAVAVLLKNMAELGRASVRYGNFRNTVGTGHFVPCQATVVFAMAEWFVDRVGYDGHGDELQRIFLFRELATLFDVMVTHPKYGESGYNFPGFPTPCGDLRKIGISPDIKILQQRGLLVRRGERRCGFGERLARYNPTLSDFDVHRIALPELVATRPNTPEVEEGEITNPFVPHQVDDSSGDVAMVVSGNFQMIEKEIKDLDKDDFLDDFVDDPDIPSWMEVVLYNPRPVQDVVLYARKPEEYRDIPLIFRFGTALSDLSLQPWELEDKNFVPPEKWPLFFELRLRPMVYILHRAVTHDFTLLDELQWWLMQILWHCHLVIRNMYTTALPYSDEDAPPFPLPIEVPGESTTMFEIILKICLSLGFPEKIDPNADLIQGALAPLVAVARKTKFRFGTGNDYYPFSSVGDVLVDDYLDPLKGLILNLFC
ncbi:hypothetical protein C8J57DRAFT_1247488 [Mycena rebaudengoi]|nr:hypothetical protein C8J57DRAFT_1247488 [Mycena rebaudengoi]